MLLIKRTTTIIRTLNILRKHFIFYTCNRKWTIHCHLDMTEWPPIMNTRVSLRYIFRLWSGILILFWLLYHFNHQTITLFPNEWLVAFNWIYLYILNINTSKSTLLIVLFSINSNSLENDLFNSAFSNNNNNPQFLLA